MKKIKRPDFLNTIEKYRGHNLIKVLTGIRRCGKSTVLDDYSIYLKKNLKLNSKNIQIYNMTKRTNYKYLNDWQKFFDDISTKLIKNRLNYIFIDEIQNITDFEHLLDSLYAEKNIDLYITGSNAFLSGAEFATLLTGRYIEIPIYPFSFFEYTKYKKIDISNKYLNYSQIFLDYLYQGSLPESISYNDFNLSHNYTKTVFNDILEKDIYKRHPKINSNNFEKVSTFLIDSIGSEISPNNIANNLSTKGSKVDDKTISSYLKYLTNSFIFYQSKKYDIKGKKLLKTNSKYFLSDIGFYNSVLNKDIGKNYGHLLENVVYIELLRRGYSVNIGNFEGNQIDFIANKNDKKEYYQVAWSMLDESVKEREIKAFNRIKDNYSKILLSTDNVNLGENGYKHINVFDWLLKEEMENE